MIQKQPFFSRSQRRIAAFVALMSTAVLIISATYATVSSAPNQQLPDEDRQQPTQTEATASQAVNSSIGQDAAITSTKTITRMTPITASISLTDTIPVTDTTPVTATPGIYLPMIANPVAAPSNLAITTPDENNRWIVSWDSPSNASNLSFTLEESTSPDFDPGTTRSIQVGINASVEIVQPVSREPITYHYRVRSVVNDMYSRWHGSVMVIGGATPIPTNLRTTPPDSTNAWPVFWDAPNNLGALTFEIEEAQDSTFATLTASGTTSELTYSFPHTASPNNIYYYRVRSVWGDAHSDWSETIQNVGNYYDNFSDDGSGWTMRREDTDDVNNRTSYNEEEGVFVMSMDSRWDYQIAGPMMPAPPPPYRIEARMRFTGVDNLQAYGLIFGGDGSSPGNCPNIPEYDTCLTQYYRVLSLWYGAPDRLRTNLKRIEYHSDSENSGRGPTLIDYKDLDVGSPPAGWKVWTIEVYPDGRILINGNGSDTMETYDASFINRPYFGVFTATDEYTGLDVEIDYYSVKSLLP